MGFIEENVPEVLHQRLKELRHVDLLALRADLKLSAARIQLLQDIVRGVHDVDDPITLLNVHHFGLKAAFFKDYEAANVTSHAYSRNSRYTYDPAKNGQNVIKHGITFGEAESYAPDFGSLIIPFPNERDDERLAIFSKMVLSPRDELLLPTASIKGRTDLCTFMVATMEGEIFRFISARTFHEGTWDETMKNAVKSIYPSKSQLTLRKNFIEACHSRVNEDLFGGRRGPVQLIRSMDGDEDE